MTCNKPEQATPQKVEKLRFTCQDLQNDVYYLTYLHHRPGIDHSQCTKTEHTLKFESLNACVWCGGLLFSENKTDVRDDKTTLKVSAI